MSLKKVEGKYIIEDVLEGERRAVIIGINEYDDSKIPKLAGAVNDAKDIYNRLKEFGNFKIAKEHLLTDEEATSKAIRNAIHDLLCETEPCDLALFYFSGHGFVDGKGSGYIAPYDMLKFKPSVCGIKMHELKQDVLDSVNKSSVLMILDCCYSGIPTRGNKSIPEVKPLLDPCFGDLNKEIGGEGKIILASSEADQASREISDCIHEVETIPHPHGSFSYQFIEGIDGKASDENGIIYFDKLRDYVEKQLIDIGKQKPKFFAADSSRISTIRIAVASKKYTEYINNNMAEAEGFLCEDNLPSLICAAEKIKNIHNISKKKETHEYKSKITENLYKYQELASSWLTINELKIRPYISKNYLEIQTLVEEYLNFDMITNIDQHKGAMLIALCDASKGEITIEVFIRKIKQLDNSPAQYSISKPNVGAS